MTVPAQRPLRVIVDGIATILSAGGDASPHYVGAEYLDQNTDAGGRYVWVPSQDDFGPPYHGNNGTQPRSLFTNSERVSIHIWGATDYEPTDPDVWYDATWTMRNNIIVALRRALATSFNLATSGWLKPDTRTTGFLGKVYQLNVILLEPVPDAIQQVATIRGIVATTKTTPHNETDVTITLP